jgi:predicted PurR-regulated permease PerM
MADPVRRRLAVDIPWRTLFKLIAAVALVWVWLHVYQLVLLVIVAILLAVTLDPVVAWVQRRGVPRWGAATIVGVALLVLIGGFVAITWSSISDQAQYLARRLPQFEQEITRRLPPMVRDAIGVKSDAAAGIGSAVMPYALAFVRALAGAIVVFALAFILTVYLLIEGKRTYAWAIAFVPRSKRGKAEDTAVECKQVIFGYVAGNVATSMFATIFVLVALSILKVPAALLLAVLAGVCDFVPVLGFIVSSVPAVLLALTVSPGTALAVAICYLSYHFIENYIIAPRVYGDRLKLSNVAVVLAFAVGAELAGIVGALIALPLAAVYPAVERIWLREKLGEEVVREHRAIERKSA